MNRTSINLEDESVEIAEGIFWVGYANLEAKLHCNPYLIVEGNQAVLIDGGNRDDFSRVMLKILRTGTNPAQITRLIYHHYDPDLCGSLPQLEAIINSDALRIISQNENNMFIRYYSPNTPALDFRDMDGHFTFDTGRRLEFYATPFCHQPGSFVTLDTKTKTLFSSDLFGSYDENWALFLHLDPACHECKNTRACPNQQDVCPIEGIKEFHRRVMCSNLAASHTLDVLEKIDFERVAPQHGSIIPNKKDAKSLIFHLRYTDVGIEFLLRRKTHDE